MIVLIALFLAGCSPKMPVDLLVYNATVYTVDSSFSVAQALVVKDGKIVEVGKTADLEKKYDAREKLDARGKFIYPGFIDDHAHFFSYGFSLGQVNLTGLKSWEDCLAKLQAFAKENPDGWLLGNGWDQNDWPVKDFPSNEKLNELFPDRPVVLTRIDGHASIANQKALTLAGVTADQKITGGDVETKQGKLTGVLIDNAMDLVSSHIPSSTAAQSKSALLKAQQNCFAAGLTTVDDCGLSAQAVVFIDMLQRSGELKMRIYAMLGDDTANMKFALTKGKIKTDHLNVRSFKVYADGALGSRGACLLRPYDDKPGWSGFLLNSIAHYDSVANWMSTNGWQMCTHAIGDSGNRMILQVYAKYLKGKNDLRWRIEHAQVVNENDFDYFGNYSIIPSVQPTHATSDMYWAGTRLGADRVKNAYAYKRLLNQNGWIPLGTDFPVEDISPLKTFYAAVLRKDAKGWPDSGYQMENALTREQALRGMTIWAAMANFEEPEKGSLEKGKFADFVILDTDLMKAAPEKLLKAQVWKTFLGGEAVFGKN